LQARSAARVFVERLERRLCLSAPFTSAPGSPISVGSQPNVVAVGDFNGDGIPDLAVVNGAADTVSVLLGNGNGTYTPAPGSPIAVGDAPDSVAVGDFTGDGKADLAVVNASDDTVSILLGNGNGTFSAATGSPIAVGTQPADVAVGDFTGNGKLDLAVTNFNDNTVSVLLGNGDGTFTPAPGSPIAVGTSPYGVAVADFNGDGKPDLAICNSGSNSVSVLLGNGDGTFTAAPGSPVSVGSGPFAEAVGDFNGDGKPDLAVANYNDSTVSVLLGNGDGSFTTAPGSPIPVGINPYSVTVADFNGDGNADIATANISSDTTSVLLGNGNGAFSAALDSPIAVGTGPDAVTEADLTGDGKPDLVVSNAGSNTLSVLLNDFTPIAPLPTGTLGVTVTASLPASIVAGLKANASAVVTVSAPAAAPISGPATVTLYASSAATLSNAIQVLAVKEKLKLKAGGSKALRIKLSSFPSKLQGTYDLIAAVEARDGTTTAAAGPSLTISPPFVSDLTSDLTATPATIARGQKLSVSLTLQNEGNVLSSGRSVLTILLSSGISGASAQTIATPSLAVKLKVGQLKVYRLKIVVPKSTTAGSYLLSSSLAVSSVGDTIAADGMAVDLTPITVS